MWAWQNTNQQPESGPGSSGSGGHPVSVAQTAGGPVPATHGTHTTHAAHSAHPSHAAHGGHGGQQPQGQELSDMLQMLDQGGSTTFEDLNMFNTTFE